MTMAPAIVAIPGRYSDAQVSLLGVPLHDQSLPRRAGPGSCAAKRRGLVDGTRGGQPVPERRPHPAQNVGMINAAHETPANLIGNTVLNLLKNPDQWQKLQREPDLRSIPDSTSSVIAQTR